MKHTTELRRDKENPSLYITSRTANFLRIIHRKDDAYMGIYSKSETGMPCVAGIRAKNIKEEFPGIAPDVIDQKNIYFTVNGYWPGQRNEGKSIITYLGRSERFLRSLNACYVDLDVSRLPLLEKPDQPEAWQSWRQAMATVGEMADRCEIAQPSIFAKSGRGLYVFWLLRDEENPHQSPPAFQLDFYKRINAAIQERLRCVAPDHAAKDGARVLRVPNSKHPNAVTVQYLKQYDENGKVPDYTLKEMAEWFGVEPVQKQRRRFNPEQVKGNRSGYKAVHKKRKRDLERLFQAGGVRQGNRRFALTVYAYALRVLETPPKEAAGLVQQIARKCSPSYPCAEDTPPRGIVEAVYRMTGAELFEAGKLRHDTLAKRFGITVEVAKRLQLETIIPEALRQERKRWRRNAPTKAQQRRSWLVGDVAANPKDSLRARQKRATEAGYECSHVTLMRDLEVERLL